MHINVVDFLQRIHFKQKIKSIDQKISLKNADDQKFSVVTF